MSRWDRRGQANTVEGKSFAGFRSLFCVSLLMSFIGRGDSIQKLIRFLHLAFRVMPGSVNDVLRWRLGHWSPTPAVASVVPGSWILSAFHTPGALPHHPPPQAERTRQDSRQSASPSPFSLARPSDGLTIDTGQSAMACGCLCQGPAVHGLGPSKVKAEEIQVGRLRGN